VLHTVEAFGTISQSFLTDRILELDRLGWESWVGTLSVANRELFPFPPDGRLLFGERPALAMRGARRLRRLRRRPQDPTWPMERFIATARPSLVHAHFGWTAAEVLPAVRRAGLPIVVGFHGYDVTVFPKHGHIDLASEATPPHRNGDRYRMLFAEADRVLVVSRFLEARLRALGYGGRVDVVPSGIRLADFPFRGPRADRAEIRLLFVGRQVAYKGLDVLLRALAALESEHPGMRLDVIGDGPTRRKSRRLARRLGLGRRVLFHGERSRPEVVTALHAADILVVPSRTMPSGQAEGLSNVVKEGLAVGLPVVATRNGGIPEVVPPQYVGELVPDTDAAALADRIAALVDERDQWEERARAGRRWVEEAFDWRLLAGRIATVYDELAAARGQGS
jgi:colanic acid/amylovoran biosynthesis glycosyltransferase